MVRGRMYSGTRTHVYVSSYCCICVLNSIYSSMYLCPHTTIYRVALHIVVCICVLNSMYRICSSMYLHPHRSMYLCPRQLYIVVFICVLILYTVVCICVLILLHTELTRTQIHTTICSIHTTICRHRYILA